MHINSATIQIVYAFGALLLGMFPFRGAANANLKNEHLHSVK
jgi:hypothetical protein